MRRRRFKKKRYKTRRRGRVKRGSRFLNRGKRQIGFKWNSKRAKRCNVYTQSTVGGLGTRILYYHDITDMDMKNDTTQINRRTSDRINCSGWRVKWNIGGTNTSFMLHYAVLCPKTDTSVDTTDFFMDNAANTASNRYRNFIVADNSGLDFNTLRINTDDYAVMMHKKIRWNSTNTDGNARENRIMDFWVPFHRQLRYDRSRTKKCTTPVFFVYWLVETTPVAKNAAVISSACNAMLDIVMWYHDVN